MPIPINNPKHNARNPTERRAQQNQRGLLHMPERNARPRSAESTGARLRRAQQNQRGIARPTSPLSAQVCQCGLRLSAPKSVGPVGRFITDCVCVSQLAMPRPSDPTPAYSKRCLQSVCSDPLAMPCLSHPAMLYRFLPRLAPHLPRFRQDPRKVLGPRGAAKLAASSFCVPWRTLLNSFPRSNPLLGNNDRTTSMSTSQCQRCPRCGADVSFSQPLLADLQ